jgi:TetR/AcrR family transcriptional repressor of nem operon
MGWFYCSVCAGPDIFVKTRLTTKPTSWYVPAMSNDTPDKPVTENARIRLLNAALRIIREKGYGATTVDELCAGAGVTKGGFFHHFKSKEALGVAAAQYWSEMTGGLFASAPYHAPPDPLARVMAYIDFRSELIDGPVEGFTCLAGTMVQEVFGSSDAIRAACAESIFGHAATLEADITEAMRLNGAPPGVTAASLAQHTQAVLQGGFILAKATGDPDAAKAMARDTAAHLKRYFRLLFADTDWQHPTTQQGDRQ